jgi:hypothetical protein
MSNLREALDNPGTLSEQRVREIQDQLYLSRTRPGNVPQWLYDRLRPGYESQMQATTDQLRTELERMLSNSKGI